MRREILVSVAIGLLFLTGCRDAPPPAAGPVFPPDTSGCPPFNELDNCANICVGFPPLNDLGTGLFMGLQGGLYPDGLNTRPAAHEAAGAAIAQTVLPLDIDGNVDTVSGWNVLMSIGISNTRGEFIAFTFDVDTIVNKHNRLMLVNAAQGGADIDEIIDPNDIYWSQALDELDSLGLGPNQVQAVWFKEAEDNPQLPPDFPGYADQLKEKFKVVMGILKQKFPNLKLCYLSSRIYGNYGSTPLNREPYAYYNGWAVKRLIEDQLNGDPALVYDGANPVAPWLSWAAYIWADGVNPRNDGLTWTCPDDYEPDGNHPSREGRSKVSQLLIDFFTTDVTTTPWFMK